MTDMRNLPVGQLVVADAHSDDQRMNDLRQACLWSHGSGTRTIRISPCRRVNLLTFAARDRSYRWGAFSWHMDGVDCIDTLANNSICISRTRTPAAPSYVRAPKVASRSLSLGRSLVLDHREQAEVDRSFADR